MSHFLGINFIYKKHPTFKSLWNLDIYCVLAPVDIKNSSGATIFYIHFLIGCSSHPHEKSQLIIMNSLTTLNTLNQPANTWTSSTGFVFLLQSHSIQHSFILVLFSFPEWFQEWFQLLSILQILSIQFSCLSVTL